MKKIRLVLYTQGMRKHIDEKMHPAIIEILRWTVDDEWTENMS